MEEPQPEPELMQELRNALSQSDKEKVLRLLQELAGRRVKVTFTKENSRVRSQYMTVPASVQAQSQMSPGSHLTFSLRGPN